MTDPGRHGLLRDNAALRALVLSRAVSMIGDGMTATVLVLVLAAREGPAGVTLLLLANALPRLGGPLCGVLADRVETRRLLAVADLASAVLIGVIALTLPPSPVLIALVLAAATLATIRGPAGRGVVASLVAPADRGPANALLGGARTLQLAVGPGLGGLLAAGPGGPRLALALDAGTFVVAVLLRSRMPRLPPDRDPADPAGVWADAADGLRHIGRSRTLRALVGGLFVLVTFAGIENVALVFLVGGDLAAGPAGYGLAASAFGAGMVLAAAACTRLARGRSPGALLVGGVVATGAGTIGTGLAPVFAVAVPAQFVAGTGNAVENVAYDTVVQATVPRSHLGRVFGAVSTAAQLGAGLAYVAAGVLVDLVGPRPTFVLAGAGTLLSLLLLGPLVRFSTGGSDRCG